MSTNATSDMFGPRIRVPMSNVRPMEPLYSMLVEMPQSAIEFTFDKYNSFVTDDELNEIVKDVGVSRLRYLQQIVLAMKERGIVDAPHF